MRTSRDEQWHSRERRQTREHHELSLASSRRTTRQHHSATEVTLALSRTVTAAQLRYHQIGGLAPSATRTKAQSGAFVDLMIRRIGEDGSPLVELGTRWHVSFRLQQRGSARAANRITSSANRRARRRE